MGILAAGRQTRTVAFILSGVEGLPQVNFGGNTVGRSIGGDVATRRRQPSHCGWPGVAILLPILVTCVAWENRPAWGQRVGPAPLPARSVSANQDAPAADAGDRDDILKLAESSLESLSRQNVVAPAMVGLRQVRARHEQGG